MSFSCWLSFTHLDSPLVFLHISEFGGKCLDVLVPIQGIKSGVFSDLVHKSVVLFRFLVQSSHSGKFWNKKYWFVITTFERSYKERLLIITNFYTIILVIIINKGHFSTFMVFHHRERTLSKVDVLNSVDLVVSIVSHHRSAFHTSLDESFVFSLVSS